MYWSSLLKLWRKIWKSSTFGLYLIRPIIYHLGQVCFKVWRWWHQILKKTKEISSERLIHSKKKNLRNILNEKVCHHEHILKFLRVLGLLEYTLSVLFMITGQEMRWMISYVHVPIVCRISHFKLIQYGQNWRSII